MMFDSPISRWYLLIFPNLLRATRWCNTFSFIHSIDLSTMYMNLAVDYGKIPANNCVRTICIRIACSFENMVCSLSTGFIDAQRKKMSTKHYSTKIVDFMLEPQMAIDWIWEHSRGGPKKTHSTKVGFFSVCIKLPFLWLRLLLCWAQILLQNMG